MGCCRGSRLPLGMPGTTGCDDRFSHPNCRPLRLTSLGVGCTYEVSTWLLQSSVPVTGAVTISFMFSSHAISCPPPTLSSCASVAPFHFKLSEPSSGSDVSASTLHEKLPLKVPAWQLPAPGMVSVQPKSANGLSVGS